MLAGKKGAFEFKIDLFSVHPYGSPDSRRVKALAKRVAQVEGLKSAVNLIIADDPELLRLNQQFLHENQTTDVIAFAQDETGILPAEIYVNLDQAREQALENGESVQKALERLVVHGLLHLTGWDDASDDQRRKMLEHGETYLK
jgi:probable rRNA maturation factor